MKLNGMSSQFNLRSKDFNISANWISDKKLIQAHVDLGGKPCGCALDLCCGTGMIGRALKENGWDIEGLDISPEMVRASSKYFPVHKGDAQDIPFKSNKYRLVACRQTFQFLDVQKVLSEVARVLMPDATFVVSLTVPFSEVDRDWLHQIHITKQPLLKEFYTAETLKEELNKAGFSIIETKTLKVKESITRWMKYAPELTGEVRNKVIDMVRNAPSSYKELHQVKVQNGEVLEDWNWIVIKSSPPK